MSTQAATGGGAAGATAQPSEEDRSEIGQRAAYEAELSRVTSADMVLQSAASLLNIGAYRLGLTGGAGAADAGAQGQQDLEQVRDAIDAVRGLLPVIERRAPADLRPLRDALSQLQMAYTRAVSAAGAATSPGQQASEQTAPGDAPAAPSQPGPGAAAGGAPAAEPPAGELPEQPGARRPGPAEQSGRLWVPGR